MCGIGAWRGDRAYENLYRLLLLLQHRGQDAAGVAFLANGRLRVIGGPGLVRDALPAPSEFSGSTVKLAIGHVRYSTSGDYSDSYQPVLSPKGIVAVAFNGTIYNYVEASREVLGSPRSHWDAAALAEIIEYFYLDHGNLADAMREASRILRGAYSLVALSVRGELLAARDPNGIRPLAYSVEDGLVAIASETGALQSLGLEWRELPASTLLYCNGAGSGGCYEEGLPVPANPRPCAFEYIYLLRPDSVFEGVVAHEARKRMGELLAGIDDVEVDVVVPVPDSGRSAAIGYAAAKGAVLDEAIYRNRFVGRVFISSPAVRERVLREKFSYIPSTLRRARVAVVDDSIVRGVTSRLVVKMLRRAGAREVHFRSASPPIRYPCFYGVDIPTRSELIASRLSISRIAEYIGADTLLYNTVENLVKAIGRPVCLGCFTGSYPHRLDLALLERRFGHGRR